jgi:hypothetical protein
MTSTDEMCAKMPVQGWEKGNAYVPQLATECFVDF